MSYNTPDNWSHRSLGMRCGSCMWFLPKVDFATDPDCPPEIKQPGCMTTVKGRCRRHAPTMSGWPVVFDTDWCGDHKLA